MNISKINYLNFWLTCIFIYLFIKMRDILGVTIINSQLQLVVLYFIYIFSFIMIIAFSNLKVDGFIFHNLIFVLLAIISTLMFGNDMSKSLHDVVYMSFWFVVMWVCFCFSDVIAVSSFKTLMVLFDLLMIISFLNWFLNGGKSSVSEVNSVYFIICLFPVVHFDINKYIKSTIFLLTVVCVLLSEKRTALIVIVVAYLMPYMLNLVQSENKHKVRNIIFLIITGIAVVFIYDSLLGYLNIAVLERFQNISTDGGSGRLEIYQAVIDTFKNSDFGEKLFGHGYNGVFYSGITYSSAHSDFLEILFDYGLIGFVFYIGFIIKFIGICIKSYRQNKKSALTLISAFSVFMCMSLTSHLILYPTYFICIILIMMVSYSEIYYEEELYEGATY